MTFAGDGGGAKGVSISSRRSVGGGGGGGSVAISSTVLDVTILSKPLPLPTAPVPAPASAPVTPSELATLPPRVARAFYALEAETVELRRARRIAAERIAVDTSAHRTHMHATIAASIATGKGREDALSAAAAAAGSHAEELGRRLAAVEVVCADSLTQRNELLTTLRGAVQAGGMAGVVAAAEAAAAAAAAGAAAADARARAATRLSHEASTSAAARTAAGFEREGELRAALESVSSAVEIAGRGASEQAGALREAVRASRCAATAACAGAEGAVSSARAEVAAARAEVDAVLAAAAKCKDLAAQRENKLIDAAALLATRFDASTALFSAALAASATATSMADAAAAAARADAAATGRSARDASSCAGEVEAALRGAVSGALETAAGAVRARDEADLARVGEYGGLTARVAAAEEALACAVRDATAVVRGVKERERMAEISRVDELDRMRIIAENVSMSKTSHDFWLDSRPEARFAL